MADLYGESIPLTAPLAGRPAGDSAIGLFGDFFKAVLNANAPLAWAACAPAPTGLVTATIAMPVVRTVLTHDPRIIAYDEKELPGLYLNRDSGGKPFWITEDWRVAEDVWTLLWIFPPAVQAAQKLRTSITAGLVRVLDRAVELICDPVYVAPEDADPAAASAIANPIAVKMELATATTAQTYSGAALNGNVGGALFAPARLPSVQVTGDGASIVDGSTVAFTGLGADGLARISYVTLSAAPGIYYGDWSLTQVTQVDVDAQAGITAFLGFGLSAVVGRGSLVMVLAHLMKIEMKAWRDFSFALPMADAPTRTYDALEVTFDVVTRLEPDLDAVPYGDLTGGNESRFVNDDGSLRMTALFP